MTKSKLIKIKMNDPTTQNFLEVLTSFEWPVPTPVSFRLYYNTNGTPRLYTMEDLPGDYIEVDAETYALSPFNVRVVDQRLVHIRPKIQVQKLIPTTDQGTLCDPRDVCVVVSGTQAHTKWSIQTNEAD
jgi:hypothetical protein